MAPYRSTGPACLSGSAWLGSMPLALSTSSRGLAAPKGFDLALPGSAPPAAGAGAPGAEATCSTGFVRGASFRRGLSPVAVSLVRGGTIAKAKAAATAGAARLRRRELTATAPLVLLVGARRLERRPVAVAVAAKARPVAEATAAAADGALRRLELLVTAPVVDRVARANRAIAEAAPARAIRAAEPATHARAAPARLELLSGAPVVDIVRTAAVSKAAFAIFAATRAVAPVAIVAAGEAAGAASCVAVGSEQVAQGRPRGSSCMQGGLGKADAREGRLGGGAQPPRGLCSDPKPYAPLADDPDSMPHCPKHYRTQTHAAWMCASPPPPLPPPPLLPTLHWMCRT
eukprot:362156-Chlamydomonas_euryale.AAC.12